MQPLTWLLQQIGSVRMRWTSGGAVRAAASATASERGVRRAGVEESVKRVYARLTARVWEECNLPHELRCPWARIKGDLHFSVG